MGKKTVTDIVKGVVITGTAIGGASVFSDMGLAYAAETEQEGEEIILEQAEEEQNLGNDNQGNGGTGEEGAGEEGTGEEGAGEEGVGEEGAGEEGTGEEGAGEEGTGEEGAGEEGTGEEGVGEEGAGEEGAGEEGAGEEGTGEEGAAEGEGQEEGAGEEGAGEEDVVEGEVDGKENDNTMTDQQLSESASASLSEEDSTLASTSESQAEVLASTTTELSENIYENQSNYASESEQFVENGYVDVTDDALRAKLDEVEGIIDGQMEDERLAREAAEAANKNLAQSGYYKSVGRPLCLSMIQERFLLEGIITPDYVLEETKDLRIDQKVVSYKFYEDKGYEDHHYCIKFVDANGQYREYYFDYVTCDEDGNSMIKPAGSTAAGVDDNASIAKGINVLIKEAIYNTTGKPKNTYNINGTIVKVYNRTGFATDDETGSRKGKDWYTTAQYKEDKAIRDDLYTLPSVVDGLENELESVSLSASASTVLSESTEAARQASITASLSASTSASEYKSLSMSASESAVAASLSQSESLSTSVSLSESASIVAATSEAPTDDYEGEAEEELEDETSTPAADGGEEEAPVVDEPEAEAPAAEEPEAEAPAAEEPEAEAPVVDEPEEEAPAAEEPEAEAPVADTPAVEAPAAAVQETSEPTIVTEIDQTAQAEAQEIKQEATIVTDIAQAEEVEEEKATIVTEIAETGTVAEETTGQVTSTSGTSASQSYSAEISDIATEYMVDGDGNAAQTLYANETFTQENVGTQIGNEQIPLAVVEDDSVEQDINYMNENDIDVITTIEDGNVAKSAVGAKTEKMAIFTLPVIGTLTALFTKNKLTQEEKANKK